MKREKNMKDNSRLNFVLKTVLGMLIGIILISSAFVLVFFSAATSSSTATSDHLSPMNPMLPVYWAPAIAAALENLTATM